MGLTWYCFGVGAAVMLCTGSCVRATLPHNLAVVLKEGWSPAPTACLLNLLLACLWKLQQQLVLYKCEFIWEIYKVPCSFSNLFRLGVSLYDSLLKWPQICFLVTHSCTKYSSQWLNACLGLSLWTSVRCLARVDFTAQRHRLLGAPLTHFQLCLTDSNGEGGKGKEEAVPVNGIPAGLYIKSFQDTQDASFTIWTSYSK